MFRLMSSESIKNKCKYARVCNLSTFLLHVKFHANPSFLSSNADQLKKHVNMLINANLTQYDYIFYSLFLFRSCKTSVFIFTFLFLKLLAQ